MVKAFNEEQVLAVSGYVSYLLEQLNLGAWEIRLAQEPSDTYNVNAGASIKPVYGRQSATLRLAHDFFDNSLKDIEHYLTHEVCHLLMAQVDDVIDNGPETLMGKPAFSIFRESYIMNLERAVDNIAKAVGELLSDGERRAEFAAALDNVRSANEGKT